MGKIRCPHCNWSDEVDAEYINRKVECPECEGKFIAEEISVKPKTKIKISAAAKPATSSRTIRPHSSRNKTKPPEEIEEEVEEEEITFGKRVLRLYFSKLGIFSWGPVVMTILLLLAADDNRRGATSRKGSAQLLQAMAGNSSPAGIITLGIFFTLVGTVIFFIIAKIIHKRKTRK